MRVVAVVIIIIIIIIIIINKFICNSTELDSHMGIGQIWRHIGDANLAGNN